MREIDIDTPHTPVRRSSMFWIDPERLRFASDGSVETFPAVLLVRNDRESRWHGIWSRAADQLTLIGRQHRNATRITGVAPAVYEPLGVLQPGDYPGIQHTTRIECLVGGHISTLLPRLSGVQIRFFPLDNLPEDMVPSEAPWLADVLNKHLRAEPTEFRVVTVCLPDTKA